MVWIAKRDAKSVTFQQVLSEMQTLARRLSRAPRPRTPPAVEGET